MRASIHRSALTKARSSPTATGGMPPARSNAATVTARLAPGASVCRGHGSAGSGSSRSAIRSRSSASLHSSASSACRWGGMQAASAGSMAALPQTASAPAAMADKFRSTQFLATTPSPSVVMRMPLRPAQPTACCMTNRRASPAFAAEGGKLWHRVSIGYGSCGSRNRTMASVSSVQLFSKRTTVLGSLVCVARAKRHRPTRSASFLTGIATTMDGSRVAGRDPSESLPTERPIFSLEADRLPSRGMKPMEPRAHAAAHNLGGL